jgi:hypothetical protein
MKKANKSKPHRSESKSNSSTKSNVPILRLRKGASRKEAYAALRRTFTAADLQKYTEIEEGIPADKVLADPEAVDREETRKRKGKSRTGRTR